MIKKPIPIKVRGLQVNPEWIFERKITKSGNGATISFFKRFVGKKVYIILKDRAEKNVGEING